MQQQEPSLLSLPHRIVRGLAVGSADDTGWGHQLWLALLVAASAAFSFVFACATPFAAFSAAAALTLSRRDALRLTVAVWLANQVLGYAVLKYPWTANSFAWGAVLGAAAILTTVAARGVALRLAERSYGVLALATLLAAFMVYEGVLFAVAVALLGGTESFTLPIVGRIFSVNAVALVGLYSLHLVGAAAGLIGPSALRPSTAGGAA
jgi:hypothetical protein